MREALSCDWSTLLLWDERRDAFRVAASVTQGPDQFDDTRGIDLGAKSWLENFTRRYRGAVVERIRRVESGSLNYLVGQVMKETKGRANPAAGRRMLEAAVRKT